MSSCTEHHSFLLLSFFLSTSFISSSFVLFVLKKLERNKTMKPEHEGSSSGLQKNGKFKMIDSETDGEVDELLAALGYKVVASDMADVAQKLEQLDMVMGTSPAAQNEAIITHLASDTVQTLIACAEAVQQENFTAADILLKQISILASSQGGAMRKVATYFAEALSRRIYKLNPHQDYPIEFSSSDILHMHFYESCPYLKFAHFTANQAILEAFEGCKRVHVIDFGIKKGMQWPALLQALALRPGGPPSFRLTGIGPPLPDNTDALQLVGLKLAQLADSIRVDFEYRGLVASSLSDLEPYMFKSDPNVEIGPEAVAVNSVFELHKLLSRQGAIEKVLNTVKAMKPKIVTVVEQEADHNSDSFSARFTEALHYYSTMFDSLEGGCVSDGGEDRIMAEIYLGKEICNVVACEGLERVERHEKLGQWRRRLGRAGFEPVHLGSNAIKQASMLLSLFAVGDGYKVEEKEGCLTFGWHSRPLIATSAWTVVPGLNYEKDSKL